MIEESSRKFSPSRLDCYKNCPRQYRYRYIDRIPRKTNSVEAYLGTAVHAALEELYEGVRNAKILPLEKILSAYETAWEAGLKELPIVIRDERFSLDDWRKLGRKCVEDYYAQHHPFDEGKVVGVESRIGFALVDKDGELGVEETYRIEGFLDRLMLAPDGAFEIHDYKTAKNLPTQADKDEDWQLAIYEIAVREAWPDSKAVRLIWHYVRHGKSIVSTRTPEQLDSLKRDILGVVRAIKKDTAFEPRKSALCDWCDYREVCPLFKHDAIVSHYPPQAKPLESGVKLVDAYAELEARKKALKGEINLIEDEQEKLKADILEYGRVNEMEALEGTHSRLEIHSRTSWKFPTKTHEPKGLAEMEAALRVTPVWPKVSKLDGPALMEGYEKKSWPREVLALVESWLDKLIFRETAKTVRLNKKKESDDE